MKILWHSFLLTILIASVAFGQSTELDKAYNKYQSYYRQRDYASAMTWAEKNLALAEKEFGKEHQSCAPFINDLALIYASIGRYREAEPLYLRALAIYEKALGKDHQHVATSLNNLALLYDTQGKYADAEPLHRHALAIREKALGLEHPDVAQSLNNMAALYKTQGNYAEAEPLCQRALAIRQKILGHEHPDGESSLNNLALLNDTQGRYAEAEALYHQAHSNLLNQIQRYFVAMSENEKRGFYQTIDSNFEVFNSFVVRRKTSNPGIAADMYNNQLAIKALLLNSTSKVKRLILNSGDTALIELYKKWLTEKEYLAKVYTLSKTEIAQQGIDKDSLEAVANDLEKQLARQSAPFTAATDTTLFVWQDVKNKLQTGEAAVEIVRFNWFNWFNKTWTDTVYYAAITVTQETEEYPELVLLENGNDLETQHFQEYLKSRKGKKNIAYQQYWKPIAKKLTGIHKVYFSPDGIYNKINLNILPNPETGKYVLDEIDIHLVTNTKDILRFDQKRESNKVAQLFGRPDYDLDTQQHLLASKNFTRGDVSWTTDLENAARTRATFSDLPGTEKEIAGIATVLTDYDWLPTTHLGLEALEEAVKAVDNPGVLHIATHGFFIESEQEGFLKRGRGLQPIYAAVGKTQATPVGTDPMLRSGLVLAGAETYLNAREQYETEDGIFNAHEAANFSLDQRELVVLSACETGLGEVQNGEGVYGLQRIFKVAVAKIILMSLWKIDDAATQELMTSFYQSRLWAATSGLPSAI